MHKQLPLPLPDLGAVAELWEAFRERERDQVITAYARLIAQAAKATVAWGTKEQTDEKQR